jgi:hypothetical protein
MTTACTARGNATLAPYVSMTELFIVGQIDALEFESKFWSEFHGLRDISGKDLAARDPGDVRAVELLAGARAFLDACRGL